MTSWRACDLDVAFAPQGQMNATSNLQLLSDDCWRTPIVVHGCDNPLLEAAQIATTDRFLMVSGFHGADVRQMRDAALDDHDRDDITLVFDARNAVNDLTYEVGVTCWSRSHVLAGHQACEMVRVGCLSGVDHFNVNAESAFARGYQSAGRLSVEARPDSDEFAAAWLAMSPPRRSWLLVWLSVGADRPFGIWTIIGARRALVDLWVQKTTRAEQIADPEFVASRFERVAQMNPDICTARLGHILMPLGLEVPTLDESQGRFFRAVYMQGEQ